LSGAAELDRDLQVFECGSHFPFRFFVGRWRLPEPGLRSRPRSLNPRDALVHDRTPGGTWQIIADLLQQTPDFSHIRTELLAKLFSTLSENMDALESQGQPGVQKHAFHCK